MAKITVILPSYNVIKYINECLDSVIAQKHADLEILCIDGASEDGTLEVLRDYEKRDPRIRVIVSEVKSYGHQVNLGIKEATGDYVGIVETDDWIEADMYSALLDLMEREDADYVKGKGEMFYEISENAVYKMGVSPVPADMYDKETKCALVSPAETPQLVLWDYYLWNGLYKKSLIGSIKLNETPGAAYQDIGFLVQSLTKAHKAVYLDKLVYHYRKSNENASSFHSNAVDHLLNEYEYVDTLLLNAGDEWKKAAEKKMTRQVFYRIKMMAYIGQYNNNADSGFERLKQRLLASGRNGYLWARDHSEYEWYNLGLFIDSPRRLYERLSNDLAAARKNIHMVLNEAKGKDCVIFGCGKIGVYLSFVLMKKGGYRHLSFCDNSEEKQNRMINGISVLPVETAVKNDDSVFFAAGRYAGEMHRQLCGAGIDDRRIFEFVAPEDYGFFLAL